MNILMMTNSYKPFIGGVERSIETFCTEMQEHGHTVLIVAPEFGSHNGDEEPVIRIPAIPRFNGTDFSVPLPIPALLEKKLDAFQPDIVHAHHPFLLGDTALRIAARRFLPMVFTHHTYYEDYTHYVPGDSKPLKRFIIKLGTGFANMCDHVIAPSRSVSDTLKQRGVTTPVSIIPTGIDVNRFAGGNGDRIRNEFGLSKSDFILGFISRIAPEKNMVFLVQTVIAFLRQYSQAHFILAGSGPALRYVNDLFEVSGVGDRYHQLGVLEKQRLADAYRSFNLFVYASKTETQGMVIAEAMAAGLPVVALDASGVRDILIDGENGRIVRNQNTDDFVQALEWYYNLPVQEKNLIKQKARISASNVTKEHCTKKLLSIYSELCSDFVFTNNSQAHSQWEEAKALIKREMKIISNYSSSQMN